MGGTAALPAEGALCHRVTRPTRLAEVYPNCWAPPAASCSWSSLRSPLSLQQVPRGYAIFGGRLGWDD